MNDRNNKIDIVKGIGIILVVLGHSGVMFENFIYLFHMSIFFIVAGYCYNIKYSESIYGIKNLFIKRMKSLWKPYVLWNIAFILLNNIFILINFYTTNKELVDNKDLLINNTAQYFSIPKIFREIFRVILFSGGTQLTGTFWFFRTLFWTTVLFAVILFFTQKIESRYFKAGVEIIILFIIALSGVFLQKKGINTYNIGTVCSVYGLMYLGKVFRTVQIKRGDRQANEKFQWINIAVGIGILLILNKYNHISLNINNYPNIIVLWVAAVAGWLMVYGIAFYLEKIKKVSRILEYIGRHTITVMCLHFITFKVVNLIQVLIYNEPIEYIASFPILHSENGWWFVYTVAGVILPIMVVLVYGEIRKRMKRICQR